MDSIPPLHRIVLMSYGWFDSLPAAIRNDVLARTQRRSFASGERVYARGSEGDGMFGVIEGSVRVSGISAEGRETVLDFYGPGSWFGEIPMLDGLPRAHDADAHGPAVLLQLRPADFEELLAIHPQFSRAMCRLEAQRLRILLMALEQYSAQSLEQRLASRLLMLTGPYGVAGSEGLRIELHLPQETLAQLIGSTRQRVNQILKSWEARGILSQQYGRIVVRDQDRLERLARM
ncbi:MAG TPA: Crp/Fnr family transcriptional regulator [Geminicoccaceae bacterium]|nr:Crp/Fnr family transcriptional regulator [Geminicoccus sp.]HMU48392.1 Crp/Fnr family transcriptional regulator [Geminicoccaceae bacterium]